jgi:hypothetical protein
MFTFDMDAATGDAVDRLKTVYGVATKAAVMKRALALAVLAAKHADRDGNLRVLTKDRRIVSVSLR